MSIDRRNINLLDLDWKKIQTELANTDPQTNDFFMIVLNKGQPSEYRTRFYTYSEAVEIVCMAVEKKRLRLPITL